MKVPNFFNLLSIFLLGLGCSVSNGQNRLTADDFEKFIAKNPNLQLIDVRTSSEFENGHLENAKNLNMNGGNFEQQIESLDKNKPVAVYCAAGSRSKKAASILEKLGFSVTELSGGIGAWNGASKKIVK